MAIHRKRIACSALLVIAVGMLIGTPAAPAASPTVSLTTKPALSPAFQPPVHDYVVRGPCDELRVRAEPGPGTRVSIDGRRARGVAHSVRTALAPGEALRVVSRRDGSARLDSIRCLPADFPSWSYERSAAPHWPWYVISPSLGAGAPPYVAIIDRWGAPVWWYRDNGAPRDAKLLPDGTITWAERKPAGVEGDYEIRRLNGDLVRRLRTVGVPTDFHEIVSLSNGNFLLMSYAPREHVDLSAVGGPADATVLDAELQELSPAGALVWSWNSAGKVGLEEMGRWTQEVIDEPEPDGSGGVLYDITHINSAEPDGSSIIISLRHTDSVYSIDRESGAVEWKLGGTETPESLTVIGDTGPPETLGGQHDARRLGDGTISIYDNATNFDRPPRAARFDVDPVAMTATLVEEVIDPDVDSSFCCGSARRSAGGSWVINWGGTTVPNVTEFDGSGSRVFRVSFDTGFTYRAAPAAFNHATRGELRAGMDAQYPAPPAGCPLTAAAPRILGSLADERLSGGGAREVVLARGGSDRVGGGGGPDCLYGQAGADVVSGMRGPDVIEGGPGDDVLRGGRNGSPAPFGSRRDLISGGRGADRISGGRGADLLVGGRGADTIRAGDRDIVRCGPGPDRVILVGKPRSISSSCERVG